MTLVNGEKKSLANGVRGLRGDFIVDEMVETSQLPETWDDGRYVIVPGSTVITPNGDVAIKGEEGWGDWL